MQAFVRFNRFSLFHNEQRVDIGLCSVTSSHSYTDSSAVIGWPLENAWCQSMMDGVMLSGATGFIGAALLKKLEQDTHRPLRALVRRVPCQSGSRIHYQQVNDLCAVELAKADFAGIDTVIHLASRVHVMREDVADPLAEYRRVTVAGTLNLARAAVEQGVRRFIFVSSIKVNGDTTSGRSAFTADEAPNPRDPYGISKQEAEDGLRKLAAETGLEVVVIRPVLVYGPGVKANFRSLMNWLSRGLPLPLGAIRNRRSFIALDNLVDLLMICIDHPAAANQTFLASDGEDLSTTELLRRLGMALGKPARLLPVPAGVLMKGAAVVGMGALSQRLCGSLHVDIEKTRRVLGWEPPLTVNDALAETAGYFLRN